MTCVMGTAVVHGYGRDIWEVSQAQDFSTVGFGTRWPPKLKCRISPLESVLVGTLLQATGSENFCRAELQTWLRHSKAHKHSNKSAVLCSTVPAITEINLHQLQWPVNIFIASSAIFTPLTYVFMAQGPKIHLLWYKACRGTVKQKIPSCTNT